MPILSLSHSLMGACSFELLAFILFPAGLLRLSVQENFRNRCANYVEVPK